VRERGALFSKNSVAETSPREKSPGSLKFLRWGEGGAKVSTTNFFSFFSPRACDVVGVDGVLRGVFSFQHTKRQAPAEKPHTRERKEPENALSPLLFAV
jgi:hypothetical protein